jgi:large subunit ribosomal protein L9
MKVILLQDVAKIGRRTEVVEVPNGYAMNQLIPNKKAEPATPANMKKISKVHAAVAAGAADVEAVFAAAKAGLAAATLEIAADMNEQDHMFQALTADEIVAAAGVAGTVVPADAIVFAEPIKSAGEHEVTLSMGVHTAAFTINVVKKA